MTKLGWFFSLLLVSFSANATLTLSGVSRASGFSLGNGTDGVVYGGVITSAGGTAGIYCASPSTTQTCNTCDGICSTGTMCACNPAAIHDTLQLQLVFTSTNSVSSKTMTVNTGTAQAIPPAYISTSTNNVTLTVPWSVVCGWAGSTATSPCSTAISKTLTFSVTGTSGVEDANEKVAVRFLTKVDDQDTSLATAACPNGSGSSSGDGICSYKMFPGDEKVYLDDVAGAPDYPAAGTSTYSSVVFFSQEASTAANITNKDTMYSLSVDSSGEFDDRITGLKNDVTYCFISGNQDLTGNITHILDPAVATTNMCATPNAVLGLLDNKKCFIATAAFGSSMNPYVELLREFRSSVLGQFTWGRNFIRFYYDHSPDWAKVIRHNEGLKSVVRFLLWPVIGFAALCLKVGMFSAILLVIAAIVGLGLLIRHRSQMKMKLKSKYFFLFLILFIGFSLYSPTVFAQDNSSDDVEEGGPPREAPFVDEDPESEVFGEPQDKKAEKSDEPQLEIERAGEERKSNKPIIDDQAIIRTDEPQVITQKYTVPKKPTTEKGKQTGSERIPHPQSKVGLKEINEDGTYVYEPIKIPSNNVSGNIHVGQINPAPRIEGSTAGINYETIYGSSFPMQMQFDYEWHPLTGFGKLGVVGGFGLFRSTGKGRFESTGLEAREEYTFYGLPLSLGAVYRLQLTDRPWLAPYVTGGGSYYLLGEKRDDNKPWKFVGTPAVYGGGGLLFNVSAFDRETAFTLASEYGVQNMWISLEARYIQGLNVNLDVSGTLVSAGIVLDY